MKKLLLVLLVVCGLAQASFAQAVVVQKAKNNASSGGGASINVTVSAIGAGHFLFAFGLSTQATSAITISSTHETWTTVTGINSSTACFHSQFTNAGCSAAYTCSSVGGDTTVNFAGPGFASITGFVVEFTGVAGSGCLDQPSALTAKAAGSPITSNAITTGQADLLIGIATANTGASFAAGTGYTSESPLIQTDATTDAIIEFNLNATAGSKTASVNSSQGGGIGIVSFKLATVGGAGSMLLLRSE